QFKVRFDRQQFESSGRQTFVDRSISAGSLGIGRDVGVLFHGNAADKKVQYSAGVFNGGGEGGFNSPERGHMLVGRVSVNPLGDFGLAQGDIKSSDKHLIFIDAAFAQRPDDEESFEGTTKYVFGAGYRYSGIYIAGEYYGQNTSAEISSSGLYAQASYMVIPQKFELAGRYSTVDPNSDSDDDLRSEIMGGFNVFFHNLGHGLKLTGDVAMLKDEADSDDSHLRTRLQIQGVF
ncbi:MAG: porin, partial [bacterium]